MGGSRALKSTDRYPPVKKEAGQRKRVSACRLTRVGNIHQGCANLMRTPLSIGEGHSTGTGGCTSNITTLRMSCTQSISRRLRFHPLNRPSNRSPALPHDLILLHDQPLEYRCRGCLPTTIVFHWSRKYNMFQNDGSLFTKTGHTVFCLHGEVW